jgi:hypothetical protein
MSQISFKNVYYLRHDHIWLYSSLRRVSHLLCKLVSVNGIWYTGRWGYGCPAWYWLASYRHTGWLTCSRLPSDWSGIHSTTDIGLAWLSWSSSSSWVSTSNLLSWHILETCGVQIKLLFNLLIITFEKKQKNNHKYAKTYLLLFNYVHIIEYNQT